MTATTCVTSQPTPSATATPGRGSLHDGLLSATARTHLAVTGAGQRAAAAVRAAGGRLDADDTGAQAAEYAMLSGVGVAIAGACIALLRKGDLIQAVMAALVDVLVSFVQSWFGG